MTVLAVLFETHCRFQKQRRKKKRYFPEVLLKVFGLFFLFPRRSSVEKGTAIFLRFSQWHDGAEREGAEEPPAESWASGEVSVSTVLVLPGRALGPGGQGRRRDTRSFPAESQRPWELAVAAGAPFFLCAGDMWHTWKSKASQSHGGSVVQTLLPSSSVAHLGKSIRTKDQIRRIQDMVTGKTLLFLSSATFCSCSLQPCWINLPFEAILATNYLAKIFLFFLSFEQWWHVQVQTHQTSLSVNEI